MSKMEAFYKEKLAKKKEKYQAENCELRGQIEELQKEIDDLKEAKE